MFEGRMASTGWGYIGSGEMGFEWLFTPNPDDVAYSEDPDTGMAYPFCCCRSGDVFESEAKAIRDGKSWMKETGRIGTITAVKGKSRHFEY